MACTGIRVRGMKYLNNFESEKILWNSRDESKAIFIWEEREGEGVEN